MPTDYEKTLYVERPEIEKNIGEHLKSTESESDHANSSRFRCALVEVRRLLTSPCFKISHSTVEPVPCLGDRGVDPIDSNQPNHLYILGGVGGSGKSWVGQHLASTEAYKDSVYLKVGHVDASDTPTLLKTLATKVDESLEPPRGLQPPRFFIFYSYYNRSIAEQGTDQLNSDILNPTVKKFTWYFKLIFFASSLLFATFEFFQQYAPQCTAAIAELLLPLPGFLPYLWMIITGILAFSSDWIYASIAKAWHRFNSRMRDFETWARKKPTDFLERTSKSTGKIEQEEALTTVLVAAFKFDLNRHLDSLRKRARRSNRNDILPLLIDIDYLQPDALQTVKGLLDSLTTPSFPPCAASESDPQHDASAQPRPGIECHFDQVCLHPNVRIIVVSKQYREFLDPPHQRHNAFVPYMTEDEAKNLITRFYANKTPPKGSIAARVKDYLASPNPPKDGKYLHRIVAMLSYGADPDLGISLANSIKMRAEELLNVDLSDIQNSDHQEKVVEHLKWRFSETADDAIHRLFTEKKEDNTDRAIKTASYLAAFPDGIHSSRINALSDDYMPLRDFTKKYKHLVDVESREPNVLHYKLKDDAREVLRQQHKHLKHAENALLQTFYDLASQLKLGPKTPGNEPQSPDYTLAIDCLTAFIVSRDTTMWKDQINAVTNLIDRLNSPKHPLYNRITRLCIQLFSPQVRHPDNTLDGAGVSSILDQDALALAALGLIKDIPRDSKFDVRTKTEMKEAVEQLKAYSGKHKENETIKEAIEQACQKLEMVSDNSGLSKNDLVRKYQIIHRDRKTNKPKDIGEVIDKDWASIFELQPTELDAFINVFQKLTTSRASTSLQELKDDLEKSVEEIEVSTIDRLRRLVQESQKNKSADFIARTDWYMVRSYFFWWLGLDKNFSERNLFKEKMEDIFEKINTGLEAVKKAFENLPEPTRNLIVDRNQTSEYVQGAKDEKLPAIRILKWLFEISKIDNENKQFEWSVLVRSSLIHQLINVRLDESDRKFVDSYREFVDETIRALDTQARSKKDLGDTDAAIRLRALGVALTKGLKIRDQSDPIKDIRSEYLRDVLERVLSQNGIEAEISRFMKGNEEVQKFIKLPWHKEGEFAESLSRCLATATPKQLRPGALIVFESEALKAKVQNSNEKEKKSDDETYDLPAFHPEPKYRSIEYQWKRDLVPTLLFKPTEPSNGNNSSETIKRFVLANSLKKAINEEAINVGARGQVYVKKTLGLFFPIETGNRVWVGASNSIACIKVKHFEKNILLAHNGALVKELTRMLSLRRLVIFGEAENLKDEDAAEAEIRDFVRSFYKDLTINGFESDGTLLVTPKQNDDDKRKKRTFLSMYSKIFGRSVEIIGFHPELTEKDSPEGGSP